jgi:hypothetical protein
MTSAENPGEWTAQDLALFSVLDLTRFECLQLRHASLVRGISCTLATIDALVSAGVISTRIRIEEAKS